MLAPTWGSSPPRTGTHPPPKSDVPPATSITPSVRRTLGGIRRSPASGTLTVGASNFLPTDTIVVDGVTYTFAASLTGAALNTILIGTTPQATLDNLMPRYLASARRWARSRGYLLHRHRSPSFGGLRRPGGQHLNPAVHLHRDRRQRDRHHGTVNGVNAFANATLMKGRQIGFRRQSTSPVPLCRPCRRRGESGQGHLEQRVRGKRDQRRIDRRSPAGDVQEGRRRRLDPAHGAGRELDDHSHRPQAPGDRRSTGPTSMSWPPTTTSGRAPTSCP